MVEIDSAARYSKSLSNDSFDASSVHILLNSESWSCNNKRRKVIITIGALIALLFGLFILSILVSNSIDYDSMDVENEEVLSKSIATMPPPTLATRNDSIRKQGKRVLVEKVSILI